MEQSKRKKELRREDVIEALRKIAFCRPNAAIELAYLEKPSRSAIRAFDLGAVAEFRRKSDGSVEIKFVDRVKALDALYLLLGGGENDGDTNEFLRALEEIGEESTPWHD